MITGFNTDIEFGGVTYHVQTEDKGKTKPLILSLVYDRGTILASKRSSYDDLLKAGFEERVLSDRLQKQHTLICAAVRAGRIEELKQMTLREAAKAKGEGAAIAGNKPVQSFASAGTAPHQSFEVPIPKPGLEGFAAAGPNAAFDEPMIDGIEILDDDLIFPVDAVQIISEPPLRESPESNSLSVEILGDAPFRGGDRRSVGFMVCRGSGRKVVREAQIMVKILGSSFRPLIFHARTDINGLAHLNIHLPNFNSGRAVFLVRAISNGEETELRRPIAHG